MFIIHFFYLFFFLSFFFKELSDTQILTISGAIMTLSLLALGIKFVYKKEKLKINIINSLIALWFINISIPILFNLAQPTAQFGLFQCGLWVFSFAIITSYSDIEKSWAYFSKFILTLGSLFACWAIGQHYLYDYMATGPFATRTSNGAFLMVTALLLAAKLLSDNEAFNTKILNKSGAYVLFFLVNLALLLSFSRGVYLSYGFSLLFLLAFSANRLTLKNIALISTLIVLSLLCFYFSAELAIQHRMDMLAQEKSRTVIWQGAWHLWQNSPWYGIGIENFKYFYPAFSLPGDGSSLENAHNDYLQLLIETGIFGISLFLGLIVAFAYYSIRYLKSSLDSSVSRIQIVTQIAVLISLLLFSCVDFSFYLIPFNILLGILFGFLYQNLNKLTLISCLKLDTRLIYNRAYGVLCAGVLVFIGNLLFHLFFYNYYSNQARDYIDIHKLPEAINAYQQAKQYFKSPYAYNSITSLYLERVKETEDPASQLRLIKIAQQVIEETMKLYPYNPDPYFQQGIIQSLYLNDNEKAQRAFEQCIKLKPHSNFERLTYGFFLLKQDQLFAAQDLLEQGLYYPIDSYYAPKYLDLLAQLRLEHGDKLGAAQVEDAMSNIDAFNFDFSSLAVS